MASLTPFGHPMKKHFLIDPNYRNLNHGSFGAFPYQVQNTQRSVQDALERQPDVFFRYTQPKLVDASRAALASLLNAPVTNCVLVKNATTAVNTVLHNLIFTNTLSPGDAVIYFDYVYGGIARTLYALREAHPGIQIRRVKYTFPLADGGERELVRRFSETVEEVRRSGLRPRLAIFETIVSNPGMRMPFEELIGECRELGVLSLVDGAHGVGQLKLDLGRLDPDFFTSNCHKWLFTPRSCALFYVAARHHHLIRTSLPTSWGYVPPSPSGGEEGEEEDFSSVFPDRGTSPFVTLFDFVGTADDSAYACVPAALEFRQDVCGGEERIHAYIERLALEGGEVVAAHLGTDVLRAVRGEEGGLGCAMSNVRLPVRVLSASESAPRVGEEGVLYVWKADVSGLSLWMEEQMVAKGTFVPVFSHGEWMYIRLSAQVYLEVSDFEWLAGVLDEILGSVGGYLEGLHRT
ncbi:putative aminotransferase family protein (LolT) [Aspergillus lucknowensis]|uniref:Pyridoxal phosphate-dependent transferase n=1 Tax=Aspergillus lucknowensis TaxID=176173 RepID=A0ABR4M892_9EURO